MVQIIESYDNNLYTELRQLHSYTKEKLIFMLATIFGPWTKYDSHIVSQTKYDSHIASQTKYDSHILSYKV